MWALGNLPIQRQEADRSPQKLRDDPVEMGKGQAKSKCKQCYVEEHMNVPLLTFCAGEPAWAAPNHTAFHCEFHLGKPILAAHVWTNSQVFVCT